MDSIKVKKYKLWYRIFLILGLYGLFDIIVGVFMKQSGIGFEDGSGLTFIIIYTLSHLFGNSVATAVIPFIMVISFTWFIWLGVSAVLRRKIIKLEKTEDAIDGIGVKKPISKEFKIALLVLLVPFGILLLIGIIANIASN